MSVILSLFFTVTILLSQSYIDVLHKNISKIIVKTSKNADNFIANRFGFNYDLESSNKSYEDNFFRSRKYLEETTKSYIRVSSDYRYNSIQSNDFSVNIHARVDLKRSSKNLKLFINDLNNDNFNNILDKKHYEENSAAIGISLMKKISKKIDAQYSFGIRSLYPFIKARFSLNKRFYNFSIEPVQIFQYSSKEHFRENTRVYIDKLIDKNLLFRTELGRGTKSRYKGMDYDMTFHLFWTLNSNIGFKFTQAFYGNTDYEYITDKTTKNTKKFNGINDYLTQISYRQNIYKKWIFYEINPGVDFSKENKYRANYRIYLKLDLFFGDL